jgi:hypothetical protein
VELLDQVLHVEEVIVDASRLYESAWFLEIRFPSTGARRFASSFEKILAMLWIKLMGGHLGISTMFAELMRLI